MALAFVELQKSSTDISNFHKSWGSFNGRVRRRPISYLYISKELVRQMHTPLFNVTNMSGLCHSGRTQTLGVSRMCSVIGSIPKRQ